MPSTDYLLPLNDFFEASNWPPDVKTHSVHFLTSNVVREVVLASSYVQLLGMRIETCPMATLSLVAVCSFSFPCVIHSLMPSMRASLLLVDGVSGEMATTTFLYTVVQQDFTPGILLESCST